MLKPEEWERVFNTVPDGITVHDNRGKITWANLQAGMIYGFRPYEMVGLECDKIFHEGRTGCPHEEVVSDKKPRQIETPIIHGDRRYSIYIAPIADDSGQASGYVRVMRDVTEREIHNVQSLWAERFTTLGQMINGIAHDVGTPLNIISGYAEYLLMRSTPDEPGHKELKTILNQTRRIAEFIKQMLDLARPPKGRIDAIGLKGFMGESIDLMGHHLRKAQVRASLLCKTEPQLVYGDAPRLRQAFFNLLLNASQMVGPEGSLEIELDENSSDKDFTKISITGYDRGGNGTDLSNTFSPFLTAGEEKGSAGMGLSLAKEILNDFGARFEATNTPGIGVGLVIYLPRGKQVAGILTERIGL